MTGRPVTDMDRKPHQGFAMLKIKSAVRTIATQLDDRHSANAQAFDLDRSK
ncbi:MAG: hypothetical protein M3O06_01280 [Pseudomonadota bacterium]|nr:hypothetical protein [Pseudomonadota bacterium]